MFLSFRTEEDYSAVTCNLFCLKQCFCCCFKQPYPEISKSIASHPSFGDLIISHQISHEFLPVLSYSDRHEAFYSGEQLLGSFKITKTGLSGGGKGLLLDASSNPFMSIEINDSNCSVSEVYR